MKITEKDVVLVFLGERKVDIYQMIADYTISNFGNKTSQIIKNLETWRDEHNNVNA